MHIVITGANRGIGLALTQTYCATGHQVTALCRKATLELTSTGASVIENIDVTQIESINLAKAALKGKAIDILINNAGILRSESLSHWDTNAIAEQFMVNALAPLNVSRALLNNMTSGAKIAVITSRMGSIADNGSGGYYGYRMSKSALNAGATSLAIDLKPEGISVAILHPGFVQTDMVNHAGDISATTAAKRLAQRIDELNVNNTGTFWHSNGEVLPW